MLDGADTVRGPTCSAPWCAAARQALDELEELSKQRYVPAYNFAEIYMGLGERDRSLAALEKVCADRSILSTFSDVDPQFDRLHAEPGFKDLLRCIGSEPDVPRRDRHFKSPLPRPGTRIEPRESRNLDSEVSLARCPSLPLLRQSTWQIPVMGSGPPEVQSIEIPGLWPSEKATARRSTLATA